MRGLRAAGLALAGCLAAGVAQAQQPFPPGLSWDWQLTEPTDLSRRVDVLALHPGLVTAEGMQELRRRGVRTVCYVSVGTLERTAPDGDRFPAALIGNMYADWPDERFLDIRQVDALMPLMAERFRRCRTLGFDAVEADNMDVHQNESGFPVTRAHALAYIRALAEAAHAEGLAIAQKNVPELTPQLVGLLDFAIVESCVQDDSCDAFVPYVAAGKAVFDAEYLDRPLDLAAACRATAALGIAMILKDRDLTAERKGCP